ncbi:hypothetical protein QN277_005013 [Acacia crassicarpa]|uniref:Uncharacterized protein n=1 Tax=Acacia crassicarpa TaxID=499986 RepID=A0AAE1IVJ3_9FABA|nr:hypothetical protein QN277_005013 [Acacia crassicarpa]
MDRVLNFDVETVHFFAGRKDFPAEVVADRLKKALADALVAYEFFAGRLKINNETSRLEIDCNGAGVGFVVASCDYKLDDVGDLVYPNPAFAQLIHKNKDFLKPGDHPLCVVQLTSFKCGGFAIGFSTSHTTFDGLSFKTFLENLNLAALAANKPLSVTPCHDRHLLAARSPPSVTFSHHELIKLGASLPETDPHTSVIHASSEKLDFKIFQLHDTDPYTGVFHASSDDLHFKIFQLTSDDISSLKDKAKSCEGGASTARISGFNLISLLVEVERAYHQRVVQILPYPVVSDVELNLAVGDYVVVWKHYQRDIVRGVEGYIVTGSKQVEIGTKLSEDSRKYLGDVSEQALAYNTASVHGLEEDGDFEDMAMNARIDWSGWPLIIFLVGVILFIGFGAYIAVYMMARRRRSAWIDGPGLPRVDIVFWVGVILFIGSFIALMVALEGTSLLKVKAMSAVTCALWLLVFEAYIIIYMTVYTMVRRSSTTQVAEEAQC